MKEETNNDSENFDEEGFFIEQEESENDVGYCTSAVCAMCGYRFEKYDDVIMVKGTGDAIHRDCWMDYSDENMGELTREVRI